jgi:hypothetical protein
MLFKTYLRDVLLVIGISVIMTSLITSRVFSQDTTKSTGTRHIKIVAKVIEDKNGKKEEFDTTINLDRKLNRGEEFDMMKNFRMRMKDLEEEMKDLEAELNELKLPDSAKMDSAQKYIEREFRRGSGPGSYRFRNNFDPRAFSHDFNFDFPEFTRPWGWGFRDFGDENDHERLNERHQGNLQGDNRSLKDILGDIPMVKVKSYTIQDTKDGKRIIIELNNKPVMGRDREEIIIHYPGPGRYYRHDYRPRIRKKVIIKRGDSKDDDDNDDL